MSGCKVGEVQVPSGFDAVGADAVGERIRHCRFGRLCLVVLNVFRADRHHAPDPAGLLEADAKRDGAAKTGADELRRFRANRIMSDMTSCTY
jgi:hypothetical protein